MGAKTKRAGGSMANDSAEVQLTEAKALAAARADEVASLRARVDELQSQCNRGVTLIERLKLRLQQGEKDKEARQRREDNLQQHLSGLKEQQRLAASQAQVAQEATLKQLHHLRHERGANGRSRFVIELQVRSLPLTIASVSVPLSP